MAKHTTQRQDNPYLQLLQRGIEADIQAVKAGALDEELLRDRFKRDMSEPNATVMLWLSAMVLGVVDDLSAKVEDRGGVPHYTFIPTWNQEHRTLAPVIHLAPPGPVQGQGKVHGQALPGPSQRAAG